MCSVKVLWILNLVVELNVKSWTSLLWTIVHIVESRTVPLTLTFVNHNKYLWYSQKYNKRKHSHIQTEPYWKKKNRSNKSIHFLCPQLQRSWRGILLLGCSSVRSFVTLFDAEHNFRTVNATVLKFLIWIPREKKNDTYFFLDRIMPLFWVMALWKNTDAILSAKYLNNCWS